MKLRTRALAALIFCFGLAAALVARPTSTKPARKVGQIKPTGSMSQARASQTATLLDNGRVLIAGGMVENGVFLDTAELYDPATGSFTPTGSMRARRTSAAAVLLPSAKVLVTGGLSGRRMVDGNWRGEVESSAELYDPNSGRFEPAGHMLSARAGHKMVRLPSGKILILGGSGQGGAPTASCEIYDPERRMFIPAGSMNQARIPDATVLLKSGKVLVAGGGGAGRAVLASAEVYDPQTAQWTKAGKMTMPRHKHSAALLEDGRVLIVGGSDDRDWQGQFDTAEIFDPATNTFTATARMTSQRFKLSNAVVLLKSGNVLVAGGGPAAEIFLPEQAVFAKAEGDFNGPHYFASATLLTSGKVVIVGGYGRGAGRPNGPLSTNHAWIYEP